MPARPYNINSTPDHLSGGSSTPRPTVNNRGPGYEEILAKARAGGATGRSASSSYLGDSVTQFQNTPGMTGRFLDWDDARQDRLNPAPNPYPTPPGGGGGGGGYRGGGGGGGGVDPAAHFGSYYKKVMEALAGMGKYEDTLTPMVNTAVDADLGRVATEFGKVGKADTNPYADFAPTATQIDPGTAAMMEAQGMGGEASMAQQRMAQQDLQGMVDLWTNYGKAQSADMQASNARFNSGVESDRAGVAADLQAARSALLARAAETAKAEQEKRENEKRQAILQLLAAGFQSGADMSEYDLGGLV